MTNEQTKRVTDFTVVDHGIDNCQYFQGEGTAFSKHEYVVTGCGSNAQEALNDCLEHIEADFTPEQMKELGEYPFGTENVPEDDSVCAGELYYYVSIKFDMA